jgi:sugar/nucleoside kinase (ribokinase family)
MQTSFSFDVAIAGEVNLDLILYGLPEQMPLDRELLASRFEMTLGGSSSIVAHNLATLGARVAFCTRVGLDEIGRIALEKVASSGADVSRVSFSSDGTGTGVTVLLTHGADRRILTYPGVMAQMAISDLDDGYLASARHFHLSSLFLQTALAPDLPDLFRRLKARGLTLSLDTNDDPEDRWEGVLDELLDLVDLLLPNERELCRIARETVPEKALERLAKRVPVVAVKCGPRGALVASEGRITAVPGVPVTPVDSIGAGDSFDAGYLFAQSQGLAPEACARAGNITGALSTLRPGGVEAFRDAALRDAFLQQHGFPPRR